MTDLRTLADLVTFARLVVESNDLEPWAAIIRDLYDYGDIDYDTALWLATLYNTYDALGSAWLVASRWPSLRAWGRAPDRAEAADYPCTQERRNLRGGRVLRRFESNLVLLDGRSLDGWLRAGMRGPTATINFNLMVDHVRQVWGVGRQAAFEFVEFLDKVCDYPVTAPNAFLWESEGPRRSLQALYGNPHPTRAWLDDRANECRDYLAANGVSLSWEDFETAICDFHVMRAGRYYPGRHLAALREEIDEIEGDDHAMLLAAWYRIVPEPWCDIAPGIDKAKLPLYRDTGLVRSMP